jgi:DNA-binding transcriptional regulator YhcF (GntR family)
MWLDAIRDFGQKFERMQNQYAKIPHLLLAAHASFLPPIVLGLNGELPIYRQLYEWFRGAITGGQLKPGQRVPSTRNLAVELKVSRIPVSSAYEQLRAEGYLETFVGAGTCVARSIPTDALQPAFGQNAGCAEANFQK